MDRGILRNRVNSLGSLVIILVVASVLYLLMLPAAPELEWGDSGYYITLAHSLLAGKGLSLIVLPTDPVYPLVPVGYPLLLALPLYFFPTWYLPLRLLSVLLMLIAVVLVYVYSKLQAPKWLALASTAIFASNVLIAKSAAQPMSEALFLCCMLVLFLFADRFIGLKRTRAYDCLLLGLGLALPITIRYLGMPITVAVALYVLWNRRDKATLGAVGLGVLFTLLINVGLAGPAIVEYFAATLGGFLSVLAAKTGGAPSEIATAATVAASSSGLTALKNSLWYVLTVSLPGVFAPLFHGPRLRSLFADIGLSAIPVFLQLIIVGTLVLGYIIQARKKARAAEWAILAYAATLLLTPTQWDTLGGSAFRYLIPVLAVGYHYLLLGVDAISVKALGLLHIKSERMHTALTAGVATALLLLNVARTLQESVVNPIVNRVPDIYLAKDWIRANTPNDAVILSASGAPVLSGLYFQRKVLPPPDSSAESEMLYAAISSYTEGAASDATLEAILEMYDVDYVAIAPERWPDIELRWTPYVNETALPFLEAHPDRFLRVWQSNDTFTKIYQVHTGH